MKSKKIKPSETVWLTLDEFAKMIGITMDKPKKKVKTKKDKK